MDPTVKKEGGELHQRTSSFSARRLKSPGEQQDSTLKLGPSSSNHKKAKALTNRKLKRKKSQSKTTIKPAESDSGGKDISSMKNNVADGRCTLEIKSPAMICAEEIQSNLEPEFPSFAKSLGLPGMFCKMHLPRKDTMVTLEDESGNEYHVKYNAELSAGWRQFCSAHNLLEGDVLVFQLVEPTMV